MNDELMRKAKALVDSVSEDVNGKPGMPFSGNGGLVSDKTIKACDDLRLAMARAVVTDVAWAKNFLEAAAVWHEQSSVTGQEDVVIMAGQSNAANFRRIKELI